MNQIEIVKSFTDISDDEVKKLINEVLAKMKLSDQIVEIEAVSNDKIRKINKKFRNIDETTDVISFPLEATPNKKNILGTIYVAEKVAKKRDIEVTELIKHGILHLAGYDHENNKNEWDKEARKINHKT